MMGGRSHSRFKRMVLRVAAVLSAFLAVVVGAFVVAVQARWDRTFESPSVGTHIRASADREAIERGRYLVYGPSHCVDCHSMLPEPDESQYEIAPLAGGRTFTVLGGILHVPNITPDSATGIGRYTDEQLARAIRYGVRHDGRALLPFMQFQNISDEDLIAILSYLRALEPVKHAVPDHEHSFLSKAVMAFLISPRGPDGIPLVKAPSEVGAERGEYMVRSVALCVSCHTERNPMDGSAIGPELAGGFEMEDDNDAAMVFVTPNLTPDRETGRIATWSEEQFLARMRAGRTYPGSHMPWERFATMSDADLRSIYRYLMSIPPVKKENGPPQQKKESR